MYSPQLGRFLNPDPLIRDPTILYDNNEFGDWLTAMKNQYGYCGNNPVNVTDPSGLMDYSPPIPIGKCPKSQEGKIRFLPKLTAKRTIGPRSETAYLACSVKVPIEENCIKVDVDFPGTMKCTRTATYTWLAGSKWTVSCVNGINYLLSSDDPKGDPKVNATKWKCDPCIINYPKPYPVGDKPPYNIA